MKRFAVNIAILPPDPVMDVALQWNQALCKIRPGNIVLSKTRYFPHISLAMGCLSSDTLEQAKGILQSIAKKHAVMELRTPRIKTSDTAYSDPVVAFDIEPCDALIALHVSVVSDFTSLLTQDATEADLDDPPPIAPDALDWINSYIPQYSHPHFWPHITVGFGVLPNPFNSFAFTASRLALCHLGNHCTCARILTEVLLAP
jgi:hypothetical protein